MEIPFSQDASNRPALRFAPPLVALLLFAASSCWGANTITLSTNSIAISGSSPNYSVNVGNINGLGLGTPATNVNVSSVGGGQLYGFDFGLTLGFNSSGSGSLSIKVTTNYTHSSVQTAYFCSGGACNTITPTAITTSYTVWASGLSNGSYVANLGTLLQPTNGAGAFTGADSVKLTLKSSSSGTAATCNLTINLTSQNAVQLTLATSGAGLTITPASDFSAAWGTVNGLGIGSPSAGLTPFSAAGGTVYETPIGLLPVYSSFSGTTGTLKVYVSSNFVHSSLLSMQDSGTSGGPYTTISLSSATPTTITTTAASNTTVTRYLGVLVSNSNGASAFSGADNATLTYQLTVP